jgi:L-alanine-DL-glutamate epimerase-like enolase superfamily enzyme
MSETHLEPDSNGEVRLPDAPGLGIAMSRSGIKKYLVDVEIAAKGKVLYWTPSIPE